MTKKRPTLSAFGSFTRIVLTRGAAAALLATALALGAALKYGLPFLYEAVPAAGVIRPYAPLLDCLLLLWTCCGVLLPFMLSARDERQSGLFTALRVTPLRVGGYFASRFFLPLLPATLAAFLVGLCFSLVARPLWHTAALAAAAAMAALSALLFIPARDHRGGAGVLGLLLLSVAVAFVLPWKWQPLLSWLPSYWFYRFVISPDWLMGALCAVSALLWYCLSCAMFQRRAANPSER